jgi:hypothetical protein
VRHSIQDFRRERFRALNSWMGEIWDLDRHHQMLDDDCREQSFNSITGMVLSFPKFFLGRALLEMRHQ